MSASLSLATRVRSETQDTRILPRRSKPSTWMRLYTDLEQLEQRLTAIEEKMIARLRATASDDALFEARRALDRDLKPYRGKMTADQLAMLEKQFLERRLLESARLPRLSLFYL